uniref:Uncharacterized protein n=1 Tax=Oncorhynchus kisutch TaxID=8019 RepID=A0A8C7JM25_ONCKI
TLQQIAKNIRVLWTRIYTVGQIILNPTEKCFQQHSFFLLPGSNMAISATDTLGDPTSPQHENPGQCLGFSALLPFLGAPLLRVVTQSYLPEVAYAQVVYGASIMSFLEGALVVIMGLCLLKALETILTLVATFSLDATLTLKEMWPEKKIKTVD